jgi:uncharacterized protein
MPKPLKFIALMKTNRAGLWTTLGGGFLIFVIWQFALLLIMMNIPAVAQAVLAKGNGISALDEGQAMFILLVGGFGPPYLVLFAWRKLMERRSIASLFHANRRFRWGLLWASFWLVGLLGLALMAVFTPEDMGEVSSRLNRFSLAEWAILTSFYSVGIVIQASFEEVFIRGWLLQHVNRFVPHALGAVVVTALIFSAIHFGHPGYATYVAALLFGLAYGWSVIRLNGLEAAIGAHIANNMVGALLAGQMLSGNAPTMDTRDVLLYAAYVLGFLLFVEVWARFLAKPSRA